MSIFEQRESDIRAYGRVYPVVFDKAENARQTDENGKSYIDFFAGAGVLNFGHNNPRMTEAMIAYLQDQGVTHSLDMMTTAKREFMETFVETILKPRNMPHKLQFMGPTGTNAVEAALKIARRATGRRQVAAFGRGFHGMTLGSLACTANAYFRGAAGVQLDNVYHHTFGDNNDALDELAALRDRYRDPHSGLEKPAAFLVETVQAEGGVYVANADWLEALDSLAKELGALLIVDDIQAGCGRTGSYFSFDDIKIDPDVICLAKGLGGAGTPMAMNLVKPEIDKHWSPGEHTGTFRGQNLSFVAGKEALSYFQDDKLMGQVKQKTAAIEETLSPLLRKFPDVELRGKGMILGLDLQEPSKGAAVVAKCFENGLIIAACGNGAVMKLIPPLTIEEGDLMEGLEILVSAVEQVMEETA